MDTQASRIVGLDCHPDSFTAAVVTGQTPAQAIVEKMYNAIGMAQLTAWTLKYTGEKDVLVLEASGNSFQIARTLREAGRQALVLESCQMGKLKAAHANNDKISAVRIAKAYLAGTAKTVWVPDPLTQERRDWMHAHRKAVKRTTQVRNRLRSYLSDHGVRLGPDSDLEPSPKTTQMLRQIYPWAAREWLVIDGLLMDIRQADEQRERWRSLIAQEVARDPLLLSLVQLCGIRDVVAFAIGAVIGDINRFAGPAKLVAYLGLNPSFDHSGKGAWEGGIGGHGRSDLRSLLVESAQAIMRSRCPLAKWGAKLFRRKSETNLVACAVARKLAVAVYYLLKGQWTQVEEVDTALGLKISKIASQIDQAALETLGLDRKQLREQMRETILTGRNYRLNPDKKWTPKPKPKAKV